MTQSAFTYKLLTLTDVILFQSTFPGGFLLPLTFGNIQVDIIIDENIAPYFLSILHHTFLILMSLTEFF